MGIFPSFLKNFASLFEYWTCHLLSNILGIKNQNHTAQQIASFFRPREKLSTWYVQLENLYYRKPLSLVVNHLIYLQSDNQIVNNNNSPTTSCVYAFSSLHLVIDKNRKDLALMKNLQELTIYSLSHFPNKKIFKKYKHCYF